MKILFRFAAVRFLFFLLGIFSAKADPESGVVVAWGNNSSGQCNIPAGLTNAIAIACGGNHSLAVNSNGTVVAWGDNSFGQTNVPTNLTNVIAVAAGYQHSLALKNNGMVVAWGDNLSGPGQANVPAGLSNVVAIAAGTYFSMALKSNGKVIGWGANYDGETNVPPTLTNATAIACGSGHVLALKSDGTVIAWGNYYNGSSWVPMFVPTGLTNVVAISTHGSDEGRCFNLAMKNDGTVVAWGNNFVGQTSVPASLTNVVAISAGFDYGLALEFGGTVVGWGNNSYGQTSVPSSYSNAVLIASGSRHNLAITMIKTPPTIIQSPFSRTLNTGSSTILSAQVTGDGPLLYQWRFNGLPISGATNLLWVLTNATSAQVGFYDLKVTGLAGTATSAAASVGLFDLQMVPTGAQPLPLLILNGASGSVYRVEANSDLSNTNWLLLAPVTSQGNPYFYVDISAATNSMRFYRAKPQ